MIWRRTLSFAGIAAVGLAILPGNDAVGQQPKINKSQLVGSWTLVSAGAPNPDIKPFGSNDGFANFESNGRFSLQLILSNLPKFASNNRATGTSEENKAVVQGSISYFGTYSVNEADGTLTLRIERCTFPNWNGTDLKRAVTSLSTEELKYTNPAASVGGTAELAWRRVK
jgi:Lipocalin-like domain